MTNEEKQLLLQDLCARQMYDVKCRVKYSFNNETTNGKDVWTEDDDNIKMIDSECKSVLVSYISEWVDIENIKPYLRPMESMTEEEKKEFTKVLVKSQECSYENNESATTIVNDWYLSKGFDVRGLIPKGLALEATEGMYNKKEE